MLISIIIPTYNRVSYLLETVNSILQQTYENYEIIIVSDGSTDNSKEEIDKLNDSRIRFVDLDKNYGYPAKARNEGIKISNGEFIAFCDDDDLWNQDKLKEQVKMIKLGYNFIFTNYNFFSGFKSFFTKIYLNNIVNFIINFLNKKISYLYLSLTNPIVNSSVLIKKTLISKVMFNELIDYRAVEDYQLWIQIYQNSNPYYIKKELVSYRVHDNNISHDFLESLRKCLLIMKNLNSKNTEQLIFKTLGKTFYTVRIFLRKLLDN